MEQLKAMKTQLTSLVQAQMADISKADCKELGEAIDMIKDLAETIYYCTITKAMEEKYPQEEKMYYTEKMKPDYWRDMDYDDGKMYYTKPLSTPVRSNYKANRSRMYESDWDYPIEIRDHREGKSPITRKHYMESKEMNVGQEHQIKELEKYMMELSQDITEMIKDSTDAEKEMLQMKLQQLAAKIV